MTPRLLAAFACSSALLAGCSDTMNDPCAGLGCASIVGQLHLSVVDQATGQPVPAPVFTDDDGILMGQCIDMGDASNGACATWQISFPAGGVYSILVIAEGYAPAMFNVEIGGPKPGECCGVGDVVNKTLPLTAM
jgi:hypothetical protein